MGSPVTSPPLDQNGYRWEGIRSRSSQGRVSASTAQPRGSGTSETKWEFVVEPGGKQVHLGLVPPGAYCLEDRWKEGPFTHLYYFATV